MKIIFDCLKHLALGSNVNMFKNRFQPLLYNFFINYIFLGSNKCIFYFCHSLFRVSTFVHCPCFRHLRKVCKTHSIKYIMCWINPPELVRFVLDRRPEMFFFSFTRNAFYIMLLVFVDAPTFLCAISFTGFLWFPQTLLTLCWDSLSVVKV